MDLDLRPVCTTAAPTIAKMWDQPSNLLTDR